MPSKIGPRKPFIHFIAEHREKNNLTQAQLADRMDVNEMTVSRWETYATRVDMPILAAIAEAIYGDLAEAEDMLHHPDRPSPNQLLRQLPPDDQEHFIRQIKRAAKQN